MKFKAIDRRNEGKTTDRQCQLVQLYIMDVIDEICAEYGLRYYLDFGSLIGAMRHNGFIPWDDDLDVTMPWPDYCRFLKICKTELPSKLMLDDPNEIPGSHVPSVRIRDRCSFYGEPDTILRRPAGIFVDIYPLVRSPNLPQPILRWFLHTIVAVMSSERAYRNLQYGNMLKMFSGFLRASVWHVISCMLLGAYWSMKVVFGSIWCHKPPQAYPECVKLSDEDLFPTRRHAFDDHEYNVPNDADKVLTVEFGDWRKLPPEEERVGRHCGFIFPTKAPKVWWAMPYEGGAT